MKPALKALGDFARGVAAASLPRFRQLANGAAAEDVRALKQDAVRKSAMAEAAGATGGFLVPPEVHLDGILEQRSPFYTLGYVQPMTTESLFVPGVDITAGNSAGVSTLYGGLDPQPNIEGATPTENEPSFVGPQLNAKNVQVNVYASNQLVWDGGEALGAYLNQIFELALLWKTTYYFLQGNGSTQPAGIVKSPSSVSLSRQTPSTVTIQDIGKMVGALVPACLERSIWVINPSAMVKIIQFSNYVVNAWHYKEPGFMGFLAARPVFVTDQLPAMGTKGDVVLFDPKSYCVGQRSLELAASDVPRFTNNQTVFRLLWRGDGQSLARNTVTLADGSTTAGVAVVLT